ncbi:hypothetical protein [Pseudobutyrivibrio xylanivorans]|uniref:Uncharacterized protein n=1 Tax=Pseudobutyrivibrio xylanivorans TaxID=185007 RepID=A0A1G5RTR0_PSEXY|nr:hypothetical protein [Pseudobutyrivibrio xylanivorans]SCZ77502.1 hypothetical protein SAMN02910350_00822 [Pseudobutyrivibrio xylanivorans]
MNLKKFKLKKTYSRTQKDESKGVIEVELIDFLQLIISVLSVILTVVSLFVVYMTLKEMQVERDAAYRPDLYMDSIGCEFLWDSGYKEYRSITEIENGEHFYTESDVKEIKEYIKDDDNLNKKLKFKLFNIGVGTAKKVEISWEIDDFIDEMNSFLPDGIEISVDDSIVIEDEYSTLYEYADIPKKQEILVVRNSVGEDEYIQLPDIYTKFIDTWLFHDYKHDTLPDIKLHVDYYDIQNKKYEKDFVITSKIVKKNQNSSDSLQYRKVKFYTSEVLEAENEED